MAIENVAVAEEMFHEHPQTSVYQSALGQAKCEVGQLRRELKRDGWEEAIRSGILHIQKATVLDGRAHWLELGRWQKYLGGELIKDGRGKEGVAQYVLALASYRKVPSESQSHETQEAILELTKLTQSAPEAR